MIIDDHRCKSYVRFAKIWALCTHLDHIDWSTSDRQEGWWNLKPVALGIPDWHEYSTDSHSVYLVLSVLSTSPAFGNNSNGIPGFASSREWVDSLKEPGSNALQMIWLNSFNVFQRHSGRRSEVRSGLDPAVRLVRRLCSPVLYAWKLHPCAPRPCHAMWKAPSQCPPGKGCPRQAWSEPMILSALFCESTIPNQWVAQWPS